MGFLSKPAGLNRDNNFIISTLRNICHTSHELDNSEIEKPMRRAVLLKNLTHHVTKGNTASTLHFFKGTRINH